ncbi:hypothetical protein D3C79_1001150 [compost metagenome]
MVLVLKAILGEYAGREAGEQGADNRGHFHRLVFPLLGFAYKGLHVTRRERLVQQPALAILDLSVF